MKSVFFLIILLILSGQLYAQPDQDPVCGIYYSYNANGERILRKYDCVGIGSEGPVQTGSFHPVLYPNPTTGPIVVAFNELVSSSVVSIYRIDGTHVDMISSGEGYELHYDLSDHIPGSYVIILSVIREGGEQADHEFIVIKRE